MKKHSPPRDEQRLERWLLFASIGLSAILLALNAHDSSIIKPPVLFACATLLLTVILAKAIQRGVIELSPSPIGLPLLGYLLVVSLSELMMGSHRSFESAMLVISSAICLQCGMQLLNTKGKILNLFAFITLTAGIIAVVGIVQYFFNDILPVEFYLGADRRVGSTLGSPAFLGGYIALVFPVLLGQALSHEYKNSTRKLLGLLLAALLFLIFVTQSRSSIIALGISMLLFVALTRSRKYIAVFVIGAGVVAILAAAALPSLGQRFGSAMDTGSSSTLARRWYFWDAGAKAFLDSPFFGHGIGNYESAMMQYRRPEYWTVKSEDIVPHAHNEIIEVAVETGIPGLICFALIFLGSLWCGYKTIRQSTGWERYSVIGLVCGITGILIDNITNVSMRQPPVMATAWLFAGLLVSGVWMRTPATPFTVSVNKYTKLAWIPIIVWLVLMIPFLNTQIQKMKASSYLIKGILAGGSARPGIALGEYERSVALDSTNYLALSGIAVELLKSRQPGKALDALARVERTHPHYPKDDLMKALALLSLNRLPEATTAIEQEIQRRDHPEAFYVQALIYKSLEDTAGERKALVSLVERTITGQQQTELRYSLLRLNALSSKSEEKEQLRMLNERLLKAFPGDSMIAAHLVQLYRTAGDSLRAAALSDSLRIPPSQ